MANRSSIELDGFKQIAAALRKLPEDLQKAAERAVLRAGAKPIHKAARGKVPIDEGDLKRSLGINVKKVRGEMTARIGPRSAPRVIGMRTTGKFKGRPIYKNPAKYSHLVEYGTSHSAAHPFIRPAVEQASGQVIDAMAKGLDKYLDKVVKRLKK